MTDQELSSSNIVSLQEVSQTCTGIQEQLFSDQVSLQEAIQPCTLNQKQLGTNKNPGESRDNFYKLRQGGNNQSCHRAHNSNQSCGDTSIHVSNRGRCSNRGRGSNHGRNCGRGRNQSPGRNCNQSGRDRGRNQSPGRNCNQRGRGRAGNRGRGRGGSRGSGNEVSRSRGKSKDACNVTATHGAAGDEQPEQS